MESRKKWEDLQLSRDEVRNIGEALKKEEFRNLLLEYVKEINDPENRKLYEQEITQLENERGVDIKFIHPSSGYVIKTIADGNCKSFINICSNSNVGKPASTPGVDDGQKGLCWSIPYCLAPPREDVDKKNNFCYVYDVVFHPDTLQLTKNDPFKKLVNDTALGAVEDAFKVSLDKINLKFPKMQFKGAKHATVIRKKIENFDASTDNLLDIPNYPYPSSKVEEASDLSQKHLKPISKNILSNESLIYAAPKYTLKHRNNINIQNYTNDPLAKMTITIPTELVLVVNLPLLKHSSDVTIDVNEKSFFLLSEQPAKYKLSLNLPYKVDSSKGNAKFDTVEKTLTVTLPVVEKSYEIDSRIDDSGVESDQSNARSNSTSSSDDDAFQTNSVEPFESIEVKSEYKCSSTNYTSLSSQSFLKPDIHYVLPSFSCLLVRDVLNITLDAPNVNPESVEHSFIEKMASLGLQISFLSTGSGFFPVNYAVFLVFPTPIQIIQESFKVEVWDNNVIIQMQVASIKELQNSGFFVGSNGKNLEKVVLGINEIESTFSVNEEMGKKSLDANSSEHKDCLLQENISSDKINEDENQSPHGADSQVNNTVFFKDGPKKESREQDLEEEKSAAVFDSGSTFEEETSLSRTCLGAKSRTQSESQQGESLHSKTRGILKIRRSLSESSVDEYASWSTERNEKTKKTVRFSDVISKQTFRMNSSILGQRKKNQRKMKNKKRAQERRLSESGNESEGENENILMKGKHNFESNYMESWVTDPESSSCDASEVSEVSDISESDDGTKEDAKPFTPCSSKKNHKRRGKKSARKNAATAKMHFMEN